MMEIKEITTEFSGYDRTYESPVRIPAGVPWVRYDGILGGKFRDHVWYWTVVPYTYGMRRYIAAGTGKHVNTYVFDGKVLITFGACAEIPGLETVGWKEIYDRYRLGQYVFVTVDEWYRVTSVNRLFGMPHPECAEVHSVNIFGMTGREVWYAGRQDKYNLVSQIVGNPYEKSYILSGNRAEKIWGAAWTDFMVKFLGKNCETGENIRWSCPEADDLREIGDIFIKPYAVEAVESFKRQFIE